MKKIRIYVLILICFLASSRSEEGDAIIPSKEDAIQRVFQQLNKI